MNDLDRTGPVEILPADQQYPYWHRNQMAVSLSNFLSSLGWNLAWPFLPLIVLGLGAGSDLELWIGGMTLAFYAVGFLANPYWGGLADHYGRKLMVLRATFGIGVGMMILPLAWSPLSFAVMLVGMGVVNGNMAAGNALLVANTPASRIGRTLSYVQTAGLVGRTMGPAAGTAIAAAMLTGLHRIFWLSGSLALLGGLLILIFVREVKQTASGVWRPHWIGDFRQLLKVPKMAELMLLNAIGSMLLSGNVLVISIFTVNLLEAEAGTDHRAQAFWVGAVAMAFTMATLVAMPLSGRLLDRRGPRRILTYTLFLSALTHLPLLFLTTPLELLISRVAFGLSTGAMQPALVWLLREHAPKGMDARAIAYGTSFQFMANGLAPFVAGLVGPVFGLRAYFGLTILMAIGGLYLWVRQSRR